MTLVVLGTLVTFVAIFSIWINRQALNTDNWVQTSNQVLQNKQVDERLAAYISNELFANVNVEAELQEVLPPELQRLAGPASAGLRQLAPQIAERVIESPRFQDLWDTANRAAHESLLKILDGGGAAVSTSGGNVTLKLGSVLEQIGGQLGVGGVASKLPAGAGELTILESEQLSAAQEIAKLVRKLPIVLTLVAILLFAGAIYLGADRRRTLRTVGWGFVFAGVLALLVRGIAGGYVVDALSASASVRPAAEAVWSIGTSLLVTVAVSTISFGVLLVVGAWLAGSTGPATALRRAASPYCRESRAGTYAVAAAVFLLAIALVPIAAFGKPLGILLFAILFAAGTELLRRRTVAEFPDTSRTPLRWPTWGRGKDRAASVSASPAVSAVDGLERIAALHRSGELTDEEFAALKGELLAAGGGS